MIEGPEVIRRSPRAAFRKLGDGAGGVLLHLDTAQYHGVNEVGSLVWNLLEDGTTFASLIAAIREQLAESPPNLEQDISDFLEELRTRELVLVGDPRP